jgi:hypothetical protein
MTARYRAGLWIAALWLYAVGLAGAQVTADLTLPALWQEHRDNVRHDPALLRYYTFDGLQGTDFKVPNLAGPEGGLTILPNGPDGKPAVNDIQLVPGHWPGIQAVRLNRACLQTASFDLTKRALTIECRFCLRGPGGIDSQWGKSGTLVSVGSGYWDGWRVTSGYPSAVLNFSLGRPRPTGAISANASTPLTEGVWRHLAAVWDGSEMRLYLDGALVGMQAWEGQYTAVNTTPLFKIGYAGYGVGSLTFDVDEVAVYQRVLSADEINRNAHLERQITVRLMEMLTRGDDAAKAGKYAAARAEYARLTAVGDLPDYRPLINFHSIARLRTADTYRLEGNLAAARDAWLKLAEATGTPDHYRWRARLLVGDSYREGRDYTRARAQYQLLLSDAEGKQEYYRLEALDRLRDTDGLADNAPYLSQHQRLLQRLAGTTLALYISPTGSDTNPGTKEKPFATLERARDAIRELRKGKDLPPGGIAVYLRGGTYSRAQTFALTEADSGTDTAPVIYQSFPGEQAILVGGRPITGFKPVTDAAILQHLPAEARGQVFQCDLKAQDITDFGQLQPRGYGRKDFPSALEFSFGGRLMPLARWPNKGFIPLFDLAGTKTEEFRGDQVETDGRFLYTGDRPRRWLAEKDLWMHGYWSVEFAEQYQKVKSIDPDKRLIEIEPPYPAYGVRKGRPYMVLNALSELDLPGEWYLDRETGLLYFWPPTPIDKSQACVSILQDPLVTMTKVSNVVLRGLTLQDGRGNCIVMTEGQSNLIAACTIRNLGRRAVIVNGGHNHGVIGCDIYDIGCGGIHLVGGDRRTLTPGGHFAENNHITRFGRIERTYQGAIDLYGCGNRATRNLIHEGPHHAINVSGNDEVVEFNEIHDMVMEAAEMGSYYIWAGQDSFSWRGNVVRGNYFHDLPAVQNYPFPPINTGGPGLHIDAMNGAITVYGNVFARTQSAAVFNGGGRDNDVENNIFVDCNPAVLMGDRSELFPSFEYSDMKAPPKNMIETLKGWPYQTPPWSTRYPSLVNILEDEPALPKGNIVRRNISFGGKWLTAWGKAYSPLQRMISLEDNWTDENPGFVDLPHGSYRIREDSPVWATTGLDPLPLDRMGLYPDPLRASWPVAHESGLSRQWPVGTTRKNVPQYRVQRRVAPITVDGKLDPAEWDGADPAKAMVLSQDPRGLEGAEPRSLAWLRYDDQYLYVGVLNDLDPSKPLIIGTNWGECDSVEIAIEGQVGVNNTSWWPAESNRGPVYFILGNPVGATYSMDVAGVPAFAAERLRTATQYAAAVLSPTRWTAEWRLPFRELCIDPAKATPRPFNIGIRKTAGPADVSAWRPGKGPAGWVVWVGTGAQNWRVDNAGQIILVK